MEFAMKVLNYALALICTVAVIGCFHATIETGQPASGDTIEESFASCWVFGLVPPSTVSAAAKCPHGVARVETQRSFVNSLVSFITFSIYTPIEIKVTCAAKSSAMIPFHAPDIVIETGATDEQIVDGFKRAADLTVESGKPVFIEY